MFILICGYPRAGKTTYSQKFENVIHLDTTYGYMGSRYKGVCKVVENLTDAVVEGVYWTKRQRQELLSVCKGKKICIWLDTPLEVRQKREGYIKHREYFEPPTKEEGWDEVIRICPKSM